MSRRVVVIGGGIVGASIAYHLQRRGMTVTLIDREAEPPTAASRASFAWMNARDKDPRPYHDLNRRSLDMWAAFADRLDADVGLTWGGDLRWTTTTDAAREHEDRVRLLQSWGYAVRLLDRDEAERLAPGLTFGDFVNGSLAESDGHVDAVGAVHALHQAVGRLGGDVRRGAAITGFGRKRGDEIEAVTTEDGSVPCDDCVLAAGADSAELAREAGVVIPMYDTFGATVVTTPVAPLFDGPSVMHGPKDDEIPLAIRQFDDGTVVVHGGRHGEMHDASCGRTDEEARHLLNTAAGRAPALDGADIAEVRRARRPIPEDGQSVLGFAKEVPNLYLAVTHSGVTLAPLIGQCASIEIGDRISVDWLAPFRPTRFGRRR